MTNIAFVVNTYPYGVPKSVTNTSLYSIVTRRTMFGLHKEIKHKDFDMMCTKTDLVLFLKKDDANNVAEMIDVASRNATMLVRDLRYIGEMTSVTYGESPSYDDYGISLTESIKPLSIECIPYGHIEKISILHYFDMLVVYNQKISKKKSGTVEIVLDCFQYRTSEFPSRDIQEMRFRDMLR